MINEDFFQGQIEYFFRRNIIMKFSKLTTAILAFCIAAGCAGCSKNKPEDNSDPKAETTAVSDESSSESKKSDFENEAESITFDDLADDVFMNIAGFDVTVDEFKYYFAYAKHNMDNGDISFWDKDTDCTKIQSLKQQTLHQLFQAYTIYKLAADNNIQLDDSDNSGIDSILKAYKLYYEASYKQTKETFDDYLKSTCCTEKVFRETLVRTKLQNKIVTKLYEEDFRNKYLKDYYCARYILITPTIKNGVDENNEPTHMPVDYYTYLDKYTYTDAEKSAIEKINEANLNKDTEKLKEAITELADVIIDLGRNGTDFNELMDKYNTDETQPIDSNGHPGQFIKSSSMPQEFSDAVNALDDNGITDLIYHRLYGYLIANKLPFDENVFSSQAVDLFMGDDNYEYQENFTKLSNDTQKKMKITINNKYADIDSSFATLPSDEKTEAQTTEEN